MGKLKLLILISLGGFAQSSFSQTINMYKTFGGVHYTQGDTVLTENQVEMLLLKESPDGYTEFKAAKKINTWSGIAGFAGGGLIVIPLATAALGGEPEWVLAVGGAVLVAASIPLHRIYKSRALDALDLYNNKFASRIKPSLFFTGTHAGIIFRF